MIPIALLLSVTCGNGITNLDTITNKQHSSVEKISNFKESKRLTPTARDYVDAGVTGVSDTNLALMNIIVSNLSKEDVDTTQKIQTLVDELGLQ